MTLNLSSLGIAGTSTAWTIQPVPAGAAVGELVGVSCPRSSAAPRSGNWAAALWRHGRGHHPAGPGQPGSMPGQVAEGFRKITMLRPGIVIPAFNGAAAPQAVTLRDRA